MKPGHSRAAGVLLCLPLLSVLLPPAPAAAVTLETDDTRVGIVGYLDLQYTFMERLPECDPATFPPCSVASAPVISSLDPSRANLILRVDRDRLRAAINLFPGNGYRSGDGSTRGSFEVMEAYGEYRHGPGLRVRGGTFLAPFGIYNEVRYAISLFAPVVLATAYEPLPNYAASGGLEQLVPRDANLMVRGAPGNGRLDYAIYLASGQRQASGTDANRDKGIGGRLHWRPAGGLTVGASAYTVDDGAASGTDFGRRCHRMLSLDWNPGRVSLEGEFLRVNGHGAGLNVVSGYLRLSRRIGRADPFVGFDRFIDKANPLYGDGMDRWSAGAGFEVNPNLYLKAEYHYHTFDAPAVAAAGLEHTHMVRLAAIAVF